MKITVISTIGYFCHFNVYLISNKLLKIVISAQWLKLLHLINLTFSIVKMIIKFMVMLTMG